MRRESLDHAAGLDPADARAPAVQLERPVDVDAHRIGRVGPDILAAVRALGVLLEAELIDGFGLRAERQARQEPRPRTPDVARLLAFAPRPPPRIFRPPDELRPVVRTGRP